MPVYKRFDTSSVGTLQTRFSHQCRTISDGNEGHFTIDIPKCPYQIDLSLGGSIESLPNRDDETYYGRLLETSISSAAMAGVECQQGASCVVKNNVDHNNGEIRLQDRDGAELLSLFFSRKDNQAGGCKVCSDRAGTQDCMDIADSALCDRLLAAAGTTEFGGCPQRDCSHLVGHACKLGSSGGTGVRDCDGRCVNESPTNDGRCDDGSNNGPNFNCPSFRHDAGDCPRP